MITYDIQSMEFSSISYKHNIRNNKSQHIIFNQWKQVQLQIIYKIETHITIWLKMSKSSSIFRKSIPVN